MFLMRNQLLFFNIYCHNRIINDLICNSYYYGDEGHPLERRKEALNIINNFHKITKIINEDAGRTN